MHFSNKCFGHPVRGTQGNIRRMRVAEYRSLHARKAQPNDLVSHPGRLDNCVVVPLRDTKPSMVHPHSQKSNICLLDSDW